MLLQVPVFLQPDTEEDKQSKQAIRQTLLDLGKQLQCETKARK